VRKKILFSIVILAVAFSAGVALKTKAGVGDSGTGWLWGGSDDGAGSLPGISWISMNDTNTGVGSYGINIPAGNGAVTGYAWSGGGDDGVGVGWIDFEPQNHCVVAPALPGPNQYQALSCTDPDGGTGGVSRSSDSLIGWARIVGIAEASVTGNSGGWEGWIKMSGTAQDGNVYGVTIESDGSFCKAGDPTTFEVAGDGLRHCAAWSGGNTLAELGFIDFRQTSIGAAKTLKICEDGCGAGTLLPGTVAMVEGDSKSLSACYDTALNCSGGGDVTSLAVWAETDAPDDAISLSGGDPQTLSANTVTADSSEDFGVTHDGHTVNITVNVADSTAVCPNGIIEGAEECDDGAAGNGPCPAACSASCALNNCSGGANWKEVAP